MREGVKSRNESRSKRNAKECAKVKEASSKKSKERNVEKKLIMTNAN